MAAPDPEPARTTDTPARQPASAPGAASSPGAADPPRAADPPGAAARRTLRALLVGIDAYREPLAPLKGCGADVEAVSRLLEHRAAGSGDRLDLQVLRDEAATREAVVAAFRSHLCGAGPQDTALFYYSGHGSQQHLRATGPAGPGTEPDALMETLVLVDSRDPDGLDLADAELAVLVGEVAGTAGHVLAVLDCCHSGSGIRGDPEEMIRVRQVPPPDHPRAPGTLLRPSTGSGTLLGLRTASNAGPAADAADGSAPGVGTALGADADPGARPVLGTDAAPVVESEPTHPGGRYVLLAACRSDQTAKEVRVDGVHRGAFTAALENALALEASPDYLSLQRSVAAAVRNLTADQSPVVEAPTPSDVGLPFLGGLGAPPAPLMTASYVERRGWVLDAGRLHGLATEPRAMATVDLYPLLGATDEAVATAQVVEVRAASSLLRVRRDLDRTRTYRAVVTSVPQPEVLVSVSGTGPLVDVLRDRLARSAVVRPVDRPAGAAGPDGPDGPDDADRPDEADGPKGTATPSGPDEPDVVVHVGPSEVTLTRPVAPRPLVARHPADEGAADAVVDACEHVGRWLGIARRQNPGSRLSAQVELTVRTLSGEPLPSTDGHLRAAYSGPGEDDGPVIAVSFTNHSDRPLHCAVLVLTDGYAVECLTTGGSVLLAPRQTGWVTDEADRPQLRTVVPDGEDSATDLLKLVVSREPFDAQSMGQAELDPTPTVRDPDPGARRGARPPSRPVPLPTGQDWVTREVLVTTVRSTG